MDTANANAALPKEECPTGCYAVLYQSGMNSEPGKTGAWDFHLFLAGTPDLTVKSGTNNFFI